jgi:hypothetical protein
MSKKERRQLAFQVRVVEGNFTAIKMFGEWNKGWRTMTAKPTSREPRYALREAGLLVLRLPS